MAQIQEMQLPDETQNPRHYQRCLKLLCDVVEDDFFLYKEQFPVGGNLTVLILPPFFLTNRLHRKTQCG